MRYLCLAAVLCLSLVGQSGGAMRECGMGHSDHPCHCLMHTDQVQNEYMSACLLSRPPGEKPGESQATCFAAMPTHCELIEQYGDWHFGSNGEHDRAMPQQCLIACTKGHCKCEDGPTCHILHDPREDAPAPKVRQ